MILDSVLQAIGSTPMVRLRHLAPEGAAQVLVKLEGGNPTGSYKDRMALAMIEGAERRGALRPGQRVVEFTGGSTGSSLAFICAVKGYPLSLVSSDAFSPEKLRTMRAFGGDLIVVPSDQGRITPNLFVRMREEVDRIWPATYTSETSAKASSSDSAEPRSTVPILAATRSVSAASA